MKNTIQLQNPTEYRRIIYLLNGWIPIDKILAFTIIFVAFFVIIWLCIYIPIRMKIARSNKIFSK
ncbi:DUF3021 family protein [Lachnospira rogosae (ex Hitch et al. 2025)]|uniref:DUF3021 family protein n=1 Tax=[Lactobacillus] rogosae TaxID=706562 RepID=UPI0012E26CE5